MAEDCEQSEVDESREENIAVCLGLVGSVCKDILRLTNTTIIDIKANALKDLTLSSNNYLLCHISARNDTTFRQRHYLTFHRRSNNFKRSPKAKLQLAKV